MFDKISGNTTIRRQLSSGRRVSDIIQSWDSGIARWAVERQPYLLYGSTPSHQVKPPSIIADNTLVTPE
jgi:Exo-beta-N-acetylmuramidase NamZ, C-terminal